MTAHSSRMFWKQKTYDVKAPNPKLVSRPINLDVKIQRRHGYPTGRQTVIMGRTGRFVT
jgi:hypothetical protein